MKVLVDMNVSPWVAEGLQALGHKAIDWCHVGEFAAPDAEIMAWAKREGVVVLTCDLEAKSAPPAADWQARFRRRAGRMLSLH